MATHLRNDRVTLTREIVSEAALALADAEGLDALTFRRLAGVLRVTPMALYNYVASKDELIEAIGARAFGEFAFPEDEGSGWQEQLRALARAFRQLLIRHPSVAECEAKG
jgi:AcrR family transcriptional regulator